MTWEETLNELAGLTGIPYQARSYVRGVIITQAVRAGASANRILSTLANYGMGIRRDQGLQLVAEERDRQAAGATAVQLDLNTPVSELLGATPPPNWTGQYVHQIAYTYRETDEDGKYLLHTRTFDIKSATVLTPSDAIAAANDIISQSPQDEEGSFTFNPSDVVSTALSGAWYDVQGRSLPSLGGGAGGGV